MMLKIATPERERAQAPEANQTPMASLSHRTFEFRPCPRSVRESVEKGLKAIKILES
jgi:hypothetical protein